MMNQEALRVCKTFIERCPPDRQHALTLLLPEKEQGALEKLQSGSPEQYEYLGQDLLEDIHFSWISPYLRTLSEKDICLFLAALSPTQAKGLLKILGLDNHLPKLPSLSRPILRTLLLDKLKQNQELTPRAFLPEHSMNRLLGIPQEILPSLIRYLGLHDLSFEMRQIIATVTLKKIFGALPKNEGEFLQRLLLHQEPLIIKRLFLQKWDGTKEHLRKLIEERGLHRLGFALYGANSSLAWYITHRLDMYLGTLLLKYSSEKPPHERAGQILERQIDTILKSLNPEANS